MLSDCKSAIAIAREEGGANLCKNYIILTLLLFLIVGTFYFPHFKLKYARIHSGLNGNFGFSVDRDRLRERERQARAAMSVQAEQAAAGGGPDTRHHHHHHHNHAHHHANIHVSAPNLFRAPVRVSTLSIYSAPRLNRAFFFRRHHVCFCMYSADIDYLPSQIPGEHSPVRNCSRCSLSVLFLRYSWKEYLELFYLNIASSFLMLIH